MERTGDCQSNSECDTETLISNSQDFVKETEGLYFDLFSQLSEHPQCPKDFSFVDGLGQQDFYDSLKRLESEWTTFENEGSSSYFEETGESTEYICGAVAGGSKSTRTSFSEDFKTRFQDMLKQEIGRLRILGAKVNEKLHGASGSRSRERIGEPSDGDSRFQEKFTQLGCKLEKLHAALQLFRIELELFEKLINKTIGDEDDEETSITELDLQISNCDQVIKKRHIICHLYYCLRCEMGSMKEDIKELNSMKKGLKIEGPVLRRMEKTKKRFIKLRKMAEHEYHNVHKKLGNQNAKDASVLAAVKKFFSTADKDFSPRKTRQSTKLPQGQSEMPQRQGDTTGFSSGREHGAIPKRSQEKQSVQVQKSPVEEKRYPTRESRKQRSVSANVKKRSSDLEAVPMVAGSSGKQCESPAKQLKRLQAKSAAKDKLTESSSAMDETDRRHLNITSADVEIPAASDESSKEALSDRFDTTLSEMRGADSNSGSNN